MKLLITGLLVVIIVLLLLVLGEVRKPDRVYVPTTERTTPELILPNDLPEDLICGPYNEPC